MKFLLNTFICLAILICASSCQTDDIEEDMVRFDRSFIPVLYFIYRGDLKQGAYALEILENQWQHFASKYKKMEGSDDWKEQFRRMDGWFSDCKLALEAEDRFLLYNQLFNIRYELISLREQEELDYYMDYLWDFEASLNLTTEVALDPLMCLLEWKEFEFLVEELNMYWEILLQQKFNPNLFDLEPIEERMLLRSQKEMTQALKDFLIAVESAEGDRFRAKARELIPVYLKLLHCYGDFDALQNAYVSQKEYE